MSINNQDLDEGKNINPVETMDEIISFYEGNEKGKKKKL